MTPRIRVYPPAWAPLRSLALLAAVVGCGHTDPFSSPPYGSNEPFDVTAPTRLTLNPLDDRNAAWLPDGSGILYSTKLAEREDGDVCLALLPPTGGRQTRVTCDLTVGGVDSTNTIESAAPAPDGRLAFIGSSGPVGAPNALSEGLVIAPTSDPHGATLIQRIPYTIAGEPTHNHVRAVRWLGPARLGFIGSVVKNFSDCIGCPASRVVSDQKIVTIDAVAGASATPVPGTDFASGLSAGPTEDEIYYTLGGDSRVYRKMLSTGEVTVAFDFSGAGIARDVSVVGNKLAAIVGGRVAFGINPLLGPTQRDSGGVVHVVDLGTGADQPLDTPGVLFRHPALSPDGASIVADGYALVIFDNGIIADTTVAAHPDIYLFGAP